MQTMQQYFAHASFSYLLFCNPSRITTEAGTEKKGGRGGGTTNREIIMIDQSEILSSSQITFIHSFLCGFTPSLCLLPATTENVAINYAEPN
jgi:hypothetical protein